MIWPTVSRPVCLRIKHPTGAYHQNFITVRVLRVCWRWALFLTRGREWRLQLLLTLANTDILGSVSCGKRDHSLLFQITEFPFRRLLELSVLRWTKSKSHCDWHSLSHSVVGVRVRAILRLAVYHQWVFLAPSPLRLRARLIFFWIEHLRCSDERMCLSFTIAAGPGQRIKSRSESHGNCDCILLIQIRDFFCCLLKFAGLRLRYSTQPSYGSHSNHCLLKPKLRVKSKLCYDRRLVGQSVLLSSTHLGLTTRFYYCHTAADVLTSGALSDERTGLQYKIAAGPRQWSLSQVQVPGTRDHILLSQIRYSPKLESQVSLRGAFKF
jgi:hypothetical protein